MLGRNCLMRKSIDFELDYVELFYIFSYPTTYMTNLNTFKTGLAFNALFLDTKRI